MNRSVMPFERRNPTHRAARARRAPSVHRDCSQKFPTEFLPRTNVRARNSVGISYSAMIRAHVRRDFSRHHTLARPSGILTAQKFSLSIRANAGLESGKAKDKSGATNHESANVKNSNVQGELDNVS
jgi:hypothetical protein